MPCNICGEEYRGLAADCACTMYGYTDEEEFRSDASEHDIQAYERAMRERERMDTTFVMQWIKPVVIPRWVGYIVLGIIGGIILLSMSGCAGGLQQVNDLFELPMAEYAQKWEGGLSHWTMEDIHIDVNRVVSDKYYNPKRPELNGYCWETAEMKHDLAVVKGIDPADMEVIVFILSEDTAIKGNVDSGSTHAVLRVGDTIYDNGFITTVPFDVEYLTRYGTIIPNVWSEEKYL